MPWLRVAHTCDETDRWMATVVIPAGGVRIAMVGEKCIGFSALVEHELTQLYVCPARQNRGVGSMLFGDVCLRAKTDFQFWVFQRNAPARRFYERHGCTLMLLTEGQDNEEREPDARYIKRVVTP